MQAQKEFCIVWFSAISMMMFLWLSVVIIKKEYSWGTHMQMSVLMGIVPFFIKKQIFVFLVFSIQE